MKKTIPLKVLGIGLCLSLLLLFSPIFLSAQDFGPGDVKLSDKVKALKEKPMAKKVSPQLISVMQDFDAGEDMSKKEGMMVKDGKVLVEVVAASLEEAAALLTELEGMGMTNGVRYQRVINGVIDINKIEDAANLSSLKTMSYVPTAERNIGSVTSQGVEAMELGAPGSPPLFGLTGKGIKVGVLSDSYDDNAGAAAGIASGDLPGAGNPNGKTTPVDVVEDFGFGGIDEGRAMIEIVHDVAPDAEVAFATAFFGRAGFANNVIRLRDEAECDVIVDDIGYLNAAVYQDGLVAQAVDQVTADGANYFSSAGNSADRSYDAPAKVDAVDFGGFYTLHDFTGNGDYFQEVVLQPFGGFRMSLYWDEPFFSVSGGAGASSDMDILIIDEFGFIIDGAFDINPGADAVEFLGFTNFSFSQETYFIAIGEWFASPTTPNRLKYTLWRESGVVSIDYENLINKGTVAGHSNAAGAMATGASAYFNTPAFGDDPALLNGFSSHGGVPILFDTNGNPLPQPVVREKPDFVGPDGGNNTFFGGDVEPDGFPNFFGTSASAPHLAALAALAKERYELNNIETPTSVIRPLFIAAAQDMDVPGFDLRTGHGYIDGSALLAAVFDVIPVPTMSQWKMILFSLMVAGAAIFMFINLKGGKQ